MKKTITTMIAAGLVASVATASVDVTLDFASAYVWRGITFNEGAVFQPGIEAAGLGLPEEYGSVLVGAWGNYDIEEDTLRGYPSSEFSEIDWYASYSLPALVEGLDLFVGYTEYTFPNFAGTGYKEGNLGLGYEIIGIGLGYTAYFNVGSGAKDVYNEFTASYGLDISEELAASVYGHVAYLAADEGDSGMHDGSLGADIGYALGEVWSVGASLTYIAQLDDEILVDVEQGGGYDVNVVGMLSLGASF